MIDPSDVHDFMTAARIAVVGASDDPKNFARTIYTELRKHGHDAVAVHPHTATVDGDPCYPDLASVPGDVDGVVIMVHRDKSADVVAEAVARGVRRIWLFKGIGGAGAVSDRAVDLCRQHGVRVVAGACPLMFLEPVGSVHRFHRAVRRLNHSLARAR